MSETELEGLKAEIKRLRVEVAKQNHGFTRFETIKRGLINGVASAIGATLGFGLFLFFLAKLIQGATFVPFIDNVLEQTGLKRIIEFQLNQIDSQEPTPTPTSTPTQPPAASDAPTPAVSVTP